MHAITAISTGQCVQINYVVALAANSHCLTIINPMRMHTRFTVVFVCLCVTTLMATAFFHSFKLSYHRTMDFNLQISLKWFWIWRYLLIQARLDIFRWQKTQQMFLTSLPASALSDDIGKGKREEFHKKMTVFSLALWLYSPWSTVNTCALTGCARDNNPAGGTCSICGIVQLQWLYYNAYFMLTTLAYGAED